MTNLSNRKFYERAALRAAIVAIILLVAIEGLRMVGKAQHLDRNEEMLIAFAGGAVYAALWSVFALIVAQMMKKVEAAAQKEKEGES
ncbi:MAG: hypothetical protein A3E78_04360 [Alphaproteobacteria bacterium RIFCSPHIGHO2_12_FULL_63_12]|nr:MAG: hypothetical protein A3E78_04360 [Alphaproteobacteria bacterium RIFCSPHIGHO2_12_FULL_63_12]